MSYLQSQTSKENAQCRKAGPQSPLHDTAILLRLLLLLHPARPRLVALIRPRCRPRPHRRVQLVILPPLTLLLLITIRLGDHPIFFFLQLARKSSRTGRSAQGCDDEDLESSLKVRLILHTPTILIRPLPAHQGLLSCKLPPRPLLPTHDLSRAHPAIIPARTTGREELAVIVRRAGSVNVRNGFPGDFVFEGKR